MADPFGISFRQLNILANHTEHEILPLPVKEPHIFKATWSLIDREYLFVRDKHTRITRFGRRVFWEAMEAYIKILHRAMNSNISEIPSEQNAIIIDPLLVWFQRKGYLAVHGEETTSENVARGPSGTLAPGTDKALSA